MKKIMLVFLIVGSTVSTQAAVGKNNFTFNIGGSFNASVLTTGLGVLGELGLDTKLEGAGFYGGGFNVDLGYLALSQTSVIHALDLRIGAGMSFTKGKAASASILNLRSQESKFNSFNASINTVYAIGSRMGKGRFLVDISGVGVGYFSGDETLENEDTKKVIKGGNNFLFSAILPLGMQYVFDSGFMIGFRHRIDLAISADSLFEVSGNGDLVPPGGGGRFGFDKDKTSYLAYNLMFSVGFAIGK